MLKWTRLSCGPHKAPKARFYQTLVLNSIWQTSLNSNKKKSPFFSTVKVRVIGKPSKRYYSIKTRASSHLYCSALRSNRETMRSNLHQVHSHGWIRSNVHHVRLLWRKEKLTGALPPVGIPSSWKGQTPTCDVSRAEILLAHISTAIEETLKHFCAPR